MTAEYLLPDEIKKKNAPTPLYTDQEGYNTTVRDPILEFVLEWMLDCNYFEGLPYFIRIGYYWDLLYQYQDQLRKCKEPLL